MFSVYNNLISQGRLMDAQKEMPASDKMAWVFSLKRKMVVGLLGLLTGSIIILMVLIAVEARIKLMDDSAEKTQELGGMIKSSLRILMLKRDTGAIQEALDDIGTNRDSILRAFILDKTGRIAYSTDKTEIGKVLDRFREPSCRGCHQEIGKAPGDRTFVVETGGVKVQRNVKVIYNESVCYGCHAQSDRINGKLIIDRSLKRTDQLITSFEAIIFGTGGMCLVLFVPFMLRRINVFVAEILSKNREVTLLVTIAKRLSGTIDVKELRRVVVDVVSATFDADEVHIIHPKDIHAYRIYGWEGGANELTRRKISDEPREESIIEDWLHDRLSRHVASPDGKEFHFTVSKGEMDLALIGIRKHEQPFDPDRIKFIELVSSHMAIAFENAQLYTIAITDELTRLFSKRHFNYCIERELAAFEKRGAMLTLLMIDIDDFKEVNDSYGHIVGDAVLRDAASCFAKSIRDNDFAFRYGGEEFTVLLSSTDTEGGSVVAERIRETIENHVFEEGTLNLRITVSIGLASCPRDAVSSRELLAVADAAVYQAKKAGKNKIFSASGDDASANNFWL
jgi:diguanylate cyclase (GGDEF)-like protein